MAHPSAKKNYAIVLKDCSGSSKRPEEYFENGMQRPAENDIFDFDMK
jgi:hypothetical protein